MNGATKQERQNSIYGRRRNYHSCLLSRSARSAWKHKNPRHHSNHQGKNNLPEILGGVDTEQVEEGFNGTDEQLNAAGELYIKDLALGGNNQVAMIQEIERVSFNTNIQNIQAVLPVELGTAANGYQGIKDMLQLSDRLEEIQINGEAANAVLEWQFNSGTGGAEAFEFLGSTDNLEIIYDVRIDNTGDAYDTGALEFIGQYTEGDAYIIRINEIEHRYTITANDLTSNGDGSGNNATDEQVQSHLARRIEELINNSQNNGGVALFAHGNTVEIRSVDKTERLRIEVFKEEPGNMINQNGGQGGAVIFGGIALNGQYQENDQIMISINNTPIPYQVQGTDIFVADGGNAEDDAAITRENLATLIADAINAQLNNQGIGAAAIGEFIELSRSDNGTNEIPLHANASNADNDKNTVPRSR